MAPKKKVRRSSHKCTPPTMHCQTETSRPENVNHDPSADLSSASDRSDCNQPFDPDPDELQHMFGQYRDECQQVMHSSASMCPKDYIVTLERLVRDLLDQNQCLVDNIVEVRHESGVRVKEMYRHLQQSASRTEEVMLALASHELCLKHFVEQHCCDCCGCDSRLMQFKLCHRDLCNADHHCHESDSTLPTHQCRTYGHEWQSIVNDTSNWFASRRLSKSDCLHNLSSEIRFTNLVTKLDERIHHLEVENEEVKHENALIRELNSMLSGRKVVHTTIDQCDHRQLLTHVVEPNPYESTSVTNSCADLAEHKTKHMTAGADLHDLITFLGESGHVDLFATTYLTDSLELRDGELDSCGGSRSDSLNCRLDNDSGCSTDLIPSQTDLNSIALSDDCEDDGEDFVRSLLNAAHLQPNKDGHDPSEWTKLNTLTDRLVPKLYNKLLGYLMQRNVLLRQFQLENRARHKCKQELSALADSVAGGLKDVEANTKAIKQIQLLSPALF